MTNDAPGIWRWAGRIAPIAPASRCSLGEGRTPLVRSMRIGPAAGLEHLYFKLESSNPTGSYKDRFAAVAVSDMRQNRKTRCIATSSGNTGSALAAYCAAAQISCEIAIVETTPLGKLNQMLAYGARLYRVRGFGPDQEITRRSFDLIRKIGGAADAALQISAFSCSPAGMSGVQTISYELAEQLGEIDHVFCPAGGGGLTLAVARGFAGAMKSLRIECVQPAGNNTIAGPLRDGKSEAQSVDCTTQISGLQVPMVLDGNDVIAACRASGGTGHVVDDEQIWDAQKRLAREEGIFCEPAAATALAGALQAVVDRSITPNSIVVCLITGSGFKDPASVSRMIEGDACPMIDVEELERKAGAARGKQESA